MATLAMPPVAEIDEHARAVRSRIDEIDGQLADLLARIDALSREVALLRVARGFQEAVLATLAERRAALAGGERSVSMRETMAAQPTCTQIKTAPAFEVAP